MKIHLHIFTSSHFHISTLPMYSLILKNASRFVQLSPEETDLFKQLLKVKRLKKKQFLAQEGEVCRNTYFVNSGCIRTYFTDKDGVEHNVQFAIENWWTGDMHSFLTQQPGRYNLVALEDTELLYIERNAQEELFQKIPKFERFFRLLLQNAFVALQDRILAGISETAEERYQNFRKKYPDMDRRIPQNQIASYLGITPESLSRVRRNLAHKKA